MFENSYVQIHCINSLYHWFLSVIVLKRNSLISWISYLTYFYKLCRYHDKASNSHIISLTVAMTHQRLSISLREDEPQLPDWRLSANARRDSALLLLQSYETSYSNCLVHVTRQHAVWLIHELVKDLKWTKYTISTLSPMGWGEVLVVPLEWEDAVETSGEYLVGLLGFFSHYIAQLQTFLLDTCPTNSRSYLYCPNAVCQEHCCPAVPDFMVDEWFPEIRGSYLSTSWLSVGQG